MINKYFLWSLSFIILACQHSSEKNNLADTTKLNSIDKIGITSNVFPLEISDSTTPDSIKISRQLVKKCFENIQDKDENKWPIQTFLDIDSLKSSGQYQKYLEHLDIGQTKESLAWMYDTLAYAGGKAYLWGITMESYEACPYYSGKIIYLSTVNKEGLYASTIKLAEISGGGDPPSFGSEWGRCVIHEDLTISCQDSSTVGEYGDDGYDELIITPQSRAYRIEPDGIIKKIAVLKSPEIKKRRKRKN